MSIASFSSITWAAAAPTFRPIDPDKYASLDGYADDVIDICRELGITHGVFVGHSVSAMIGAIASLKAPDIFDDLIMIGPSPRYVNDE